jgi:hypothetical protein
MIAEWHPFLNDQKTHLPAVSCADVGELPVSAIPILAQTVFPQQWQCHQIFELRAGIATHQPGVKEVQFGLLCHRAGNGSMVWNNAKDYKVNQRKFSTARTDGSVITIPIYGDRLPI